MKLRRTLILPCLFALILVLFSCDLFKPPDDGPPDTRTLPVPDWVINLGAEYDQDTLGINPRSIWRYEYKESSFFHIPAYYPGGFDMLYSYYGTLLGTTEPEVSIEGYYNYSDFSDSASNPILVWENVTQPNLYRSEDHMIVNAVIDYFKPDSGYLCIRTGTLRYFDIENLNRHFTDRGFDYQQSTLTSLALKNYSAQTWNADSLSSFVVTIDNDTYDSLYTEGGWDAFEDMYPGEHGLIDLTLPGIDSCGTHAIIEVHWRHSRSGGANYGIILEKAVEDDWQVKELTTVVLFDYWG